MKMTCSMLPGAQFISALPSYIFSPQSPLNRVMHTSLWTMLTLISCKEAIQPRFTSQAAILLRSLRTSLDHGTFSRSNRLQPYFKKTSEPISGRLFLFSSRDEEGCKRQFRSFAEYIAALLSDRDRPKHVLRDLAFILSDKRTRLPWSSYVHATSLAALQTRLLNETTIPKPRKRREKPGICFCFSGQGAQWASMGKELYDAFTIFQNSVDRSAKYLRDALGCTWDATTEMFAGKQESRLDEPTFSQTLCTILQIAMIDQLVSWNIRADYVVGHSSGEISAAYACGALTRLRVRSTGGIGESAGGKELRPVCTQLEWQLVADMKPLSMTTGLIADPDILLILQEQSSTIATSIAASIHDRLRSKRMSCRAVSWPAPSELLAGRIVISLLDLDKAKFASPSASDFEGLRATITGPARLIWISPMSALGSIVVGLARSVRNEIPSLNFQCVQVDLSEYDELALVNSVISLATCATQDSEFSQQGTKLLAPRYAPHTMMDTAIADFVEGNEKIVFVSLPDLGDKRKVHLTQPGVLNSFCYAAADTATSPLLDDEVEIEVRASGLNFRDMSIAMGDTKHTSGRRVASSVVSLCCAFGHCDSCWSQ